MIWVSTRYDEERAIMLFGGRVAVSDLAGAASIQVATDADCLAALHNLSQRTGIDIYHSCCLPLVATAPSPGRRR